MDDQWEDEDDEEVKPWDSERYQRDAEHIYHHHGLRFGLWSWLGLVTALSVGIFLGNFLTSLFLPTATPPIGAFHDRP